MIYKELLQRVQRSQAASRYFLLFELTEGGDDVEFEAEDRTISFANNSVSPSTAPEINVIVGPER